jgi:hypothetical protein
VDTVEYEDGKAFVVSSFVSEDAAEAGGSASLILKKMAVLNRRWRERNAPSAQHRQRER